MSVLVIVTDLIFSTKIVSTARVLNVPMTAVRSLETLGQRLTENPTLILIDLNVTALDPLAAIRQIKAAPNPPRIVAFLSHVQVDLAVAARQAGADEVLPRSAFSNNLPAILQAAKA
jgi:CheY-like chemotaxis protein